MRFDATFKLILIGDSGVGKSCIIKRIGSNTFNMEHEVTIGAEFTTIAARINKKTFMKMQFWDSCGQERYNSITRIFYRGSSCVLLVYDVTK
jgi:small GTP-binding protein